MNFHFFKKRIQTPSSVYCPCCNQSFVSFLPTGTPVRANALCPHCRSYERHRLIWLYLEHHTAIFKSSKLKVLHVAPERVFYNKFKAMPGIDYTPVDKFAPGYKYPDGTLNEDVTALKLPDNSYDLILCNHVLEHVQDDAQAMRELYRVLKPGGTAILQVPIDCRLDQTFEDPTITGEAERTKAYGQHDHVRLYGRDYGQRLVAAGFEVKVNDLVKTISKDDLFKYGLHKDELLYIATKIT